METQNRNFEAGALPHPPQILLISRIIIYQGFP